VRPRVKSFLVRFIIENYNILDISIYIHGSIQKNRARKAFVVMSMGKVQSSPASEDDKHFGSRLQVYIVVDTNHSC